MRFHGFLLLSLVSCSPFDGITSFGELNDLMEQRFARKATLSLEDFERRIPTDREKSSMRNLMDLLVGRSDMNDCNPSFLDIFPYLEDSLQLTPFLNSFCVIHEPLPTDPSTLFPRLFGYAVIRMDRDALPLHHSATHFESDGPVNKQAAILFENTRSKTLVVNGMSRFAVKGNPHSSCQPGNTIADAAHNTELMFHWMLKGIYDARMNKVGDHFIQWHGMAETSCVNTTAFVSLGASGSNPIYSQSNAAEKIARTFTSESGGNMNASTPHTYGNCNLVAASNVFGRYVHGVPESQVCTTHATMMNDAFIHIEQKRAAREDFSVWTRTLLKVFNPSIVHDGLRY